MNSGWSSCKEILIIRADNMGDLIMSSPAIRAVKETSQSRITVLTSSMAAGIAKQIPEIDDVLVYSLPWVQAKESARPESFFELVQTLKSRKFDGAIVFSVYSQNSQPAAMLAYLAEIPLRLGYSRENPYELLTHWVPDPEPFSVIKHQVRRDLDLVAQIGAFTGNESFVLEHYDEKAWKLTSLKLRKMGVDTIKPLIVLHAGVSERKREYPFASWVKFSKSILATTDCQLLFTGIGSEKTLTDKLAFAAGENSFSVAGALTLEEFTELIRHSALVVSVNTATVHIAAAVKTPVMVLYALTNPQHSPWKAFGKLFPFPVPQEIQSKNRIVQYVNERYFGDFSRIVEPEELVEATLKILNNELEEIPELIMIQETTA
ncbi:glycosyltransferase family 9 protein [Pedobacter sp. HMF7647]|uniref:Glycosyltransferase family 9 protein n=2 Tax=Hufsiella arboris TaxID=2695275 RepID=A0A7K1YCT7_9SPHI|nr:glycosyltransferase family 9 protein [Hufsiella arboris]